MVITVLVGSFLLLMVLGFPLAYAMGVSTLLYMLLFSSGDLIMIVQRISTGVYSFPMLAVPFFIFAGTLMNYVGVTERLFNFARKLVGHVQGGLGHVNVLASMLFAGMSGSAIADAGGLGAIEVKAMTEAGYSRRFSAAITAASSTIGPIIPPSIIIIIYAVLAEVSIGKLFAAAIIPGILMGISLMVFIYIRAKRGIDVAPVEPKATFAEIRKSFVKAFLPLLAPIILLVGIFSGYFTATEAGAVAVAYTFLLGLILKTLNIKVILQSLKETLEATVLTLFFIASAQIFMWVVTIEKIPSTVINGVLDLTSNKYIVLFILILVLIIMGMFMSIEATLILSVPVLIELAQQLNFDLVHLGIVVIVTLMVGIVTPPVGIGLFIVSEVAKVPYSELSRAIVPFLVPLLTVIFIIAYFPWLVMIIPNLLY